jgi:GrpB-like predicted nucleotidyltransferase (UPF0157 family)
MSDMPLGLARNEVRLVPYDPRWGHCYEAAAAELSTCLGDHIGAVEHIGSTAIPGVDAKPIIDLMAAVRSLTLPSSFISAVQALGYQHRGHDPVRHRLYFRLRANAHLTREYVALKVRLAVTFPQDRLAYDAEKADFIRSVIESRAAAR